MNRGGSWRNDDPANFRAANRNRNSPGNRNDNQGFRLASPASSQGRKLSQPCGIESRRGGNETSQLAAASTPGSPGPPPPPAPFDCAWESLAMSDAGGGILTRQGPQRFRIEHPLAVNAKNGSLLVYVPGGSFEMGDGRDDDCLKRFVDLSGYWIGVHAVTNAQYGRFVSATGHRRPDAADYGAPVWRNGGYPEEKADHPVVCVSWEDATAYARWAGCILPTEAQWEKAARGPKGLIYPWGDEWDGSRCRHDKNRGGETTIAVSGYASGVSGYGTYQQSGNVWEWCSDWYDENHYRSSPPRDPGGPSGGSDRVARGGGWRRGAPAGFRAANRGRRSPGDRLDHLGFRLARIA